MMLSDIRNSFRTGDISIYPLVLKNSTNPEAGKVKIVSARKSVKWVEVDHYGDSPMESWEDVLSFLESEIGKLSKLNALSYISMEEVREYWDELNNPSVVTNPPDVDDVDYLKVSDDGISSIIHYLDIHDDDPRFEPGFWEPILAAWENTKTKIEDMLLNGELIKL